MPSENFKVGIIIFPGTNCNIETKKAVESAGFEAEYIWHEEKGKAKKFGAVIIPGGFSYGDYLRAGKMAVFSPVMEDIIEMSEKGNPILGICNGFQILCESKVLPGTLLMNIGTKFICRWVELEVVDNQTPFTCAMQKGERIKMPIAHRFGNYFYENEEPNVVLRYVSNPNGSKDSIAGISNAKKNVVGLMPHPERASFKFLGSEDGMKIFKSLKKWLKE